MEMGFQKAPIECGTGNAECENKSLINRQFLTFSFRTPAPRSKFCLPVQFRFLHRFRHPKSEFKICQETRKSPLLPLFQTDLYP